jgi:hypothetical protein
MPKGPTKAWFQAKLDEERMAHMHARRDLELFRERAVTAAGILNELRMCMVVSDPWLEQRIEDFLGASTTSAGLHVSQHAPHPAIERIRREWREKPR